MTSFEFRFESKSIAQQFIDWMYCRSDANFGWGDERDGMNVGPFALYSGKWLVKFVAWVSEKEKAAIEAAANGSFAPSGCRPDECDFCDKRLAAAN